MKKLFFFDIDGTLIDCSRGLYSISENNKKALTKLQKKYPAFIATGRPKCFVEDSIVSFPFDGFITCNGAYVELNGKCMSKKLMLPHEVDTLIKVCQKYHFDFYLCGHQYIYVNDLKSNRVINFAKVWKMKSSIMKDEFDINQIEVHGAMIVVNNPKDAMIVQQELGDLFDIGQHQDALSFDINIKGITKATAILEVSKQLEILLENTYAFGDGLNDIEMIQTVGHGIAMKNAVCQLKEVANEICDDVLEDGVSKVINKLI